MNRIAIALLGLYVGLLPFQITLDFSEVNRIRVGPSDLLLLVLVLLYANRLRLVRPTWTGWHTALLFLIPSSALAVSFLVEPVALGILFAKVIGMVALAALYIAVTTFVRDWEDARRLLRILVIVTVVQNIPATVTYVARINTPLMNGDGSRLSGMLPDPNAYGSLLVVTFALLLATASSETPLIGRRTTWIASITLPVSIILTSSRTTWIAFGVVLLLYAFAKPGIALRYLTVVGTALAVAAILIVPDLTSQQITLGSRGSGGRFDLASQTMEAFWQSPIFGVGIGQFYEQHGEIIHNTVGWFLGEFGFFGLVIISGLLLTMASWAHALYQTSEEPGKSIALGLGLAFAGMCVSSLGIEALYQRWWWLIMGLIAALYAPVSSTLSPPDVPYVDQPAPSRTLPPRPKETRTRYWD